MFNKFKENIKTTVYDGYKILDFRSNLSVLGINSGEECLANVKLYDGVDEEKTIKKMWEELLKEINKFKNNNKK